MSEELPLCECGCGERVTRKGNRFINYHNTPIKKGSHHKEGNHHKVRDMRGKNNPMYGVTQSPEILAKKGKTISKIHLTEKEPLHDGWDSKVLTTNENCSVYFGNIGEQRISEMYSDVQVMPAQSPGYDIIYNDNKIDVKSAFTGDKRSFWEFSIEKNTLTNYFLCMAFNNRKDRALVHVWLIPGNIINNKGRITIRKSTLDTWAKYERSLTEILKPLNVEPKGL